jgi:hypothetical protein
MIIPTKTMIEETEQVVVISDDSEASFAPFLCQGEFPSFAIPLHKVQDSIGQRVPPFVLLHLPMSQSRKEEANLFFSRLRVASMNPPVLLLVSCETQSEIRKERNWFSGLGIKWKILPNPNAFILTSAAASIARKRGNESMANTVVVIGDGLTASLICTKIKADGGSIHKLSPNQKIGDELRILKPAVVVVCLPPLRSLSDSIDASFFQHLTSCPEFVSVGHESSIDTEALTNALDSGLISSAYINLFGYPQSGPFCIQKEDHGTPENRRNGGDRKAPFVVCRASTDLRVSRAAWDMVHALCSNKTNFNIPEQFVFYEKIGRVFFDV